ncbi:MAG: heme o synthase [bacterium]|nr:heme o synthase [bacterium]MCY3926306.1 heme o synthase [bacterium]
MPATRARARIASYAALTKPRIVELLLVTTVPTMIVAEGGLPSLWLMAAVVVGGALAAGGANALNMVIDRDIDSVMRRTQDRPLVTGDVSPRSALVFAVALEVAAFVWLWLFVNLLSAALATGATLFYVFVYSLWLKRRSERNIVIGGAAGAVPVLVGWTAVQGRLDWAPLLLFAVIFYWTPPHFWALAVRYRDDYAQAGVPMLPAVRSIRTVALRIIAYTAVLWATSIAFGVVADLGVLYLATALTTGAVFVALGVRLLRERTPQVAMRLFNWSISYVVLLFGAMAADRLI